MLIATFSIPPEALALADAIEAVPDLNLEAERIAAHSTEWVMPCLWVSGTDLDAIREAFQDDPTVDAIVTSATFNAEAFYHVEWADEVERRIDTLIDKQATILEARLDDGRWLLRIRFSSREQLDEFRDYFDDRGYPFQLLQLFEPDTPRFAYGSLTPSQRNAMVMAVKHGYFRIPREISARELAAKLGTSHQAVSELLRRGTENLINATLTIPGESDRR